MIIPACSVSGNVPVGAFFTKKKTLFRRYEAPDTTIDPATGHPFFSPMINKPRRRRLSNGRRSHTDDNDDRRQQETKTDRGRRNRTWRRLRGGRETGSEDGGEEGEGEGSRQQSVHSRLWEKGVALNRRRAADVRVREEARRERASVGHVSSRYLL